MDPNSHSSQEHKAKQLNQVLQLLIEDDALLPSSQKVIAYEIQGKLVQADLELSFEAGEVFDLVEAAMRLETEAIADPDQRENADELGYYLQEHFRILENKAARADLMLEIQSTMQRILLGEAPTSPFGSWQTSAEEAEEEEEEEYELPGLLGVRLLLIVVKNQLRLKSGGYPMAFLPDSEAEILRFSESIQALLTNPWEMEPEMVSRLSIFNILVKKQVADMKGDDQAVTDQFDGLDQSFTKETTDWMVLYCREFLNGTEIRRSQNWDPAELAAGPFLMDAIRFGRMYSDEKKEWQEKLKGDANSIIWKHTLRSTGIGVLPLPIVDMVGISIVNRAMVKELSLLYGIAFDEVKTRSTIGALAGGVGAVAVGGALVGSVVKIIPGVGSLLGATSVSISSGATTYALGRVFTDQFSQGISIKDMDLNKGIDMMKDMYAEGVDLVKEKVQTIQKKTEE